MAVSADYWLYTDEPVDTGLMFQQAPTTDPSASPPRAAVADVDDDDEASPSSVVMMVTTNSGLWRICVYPKVDHSGDDY